MPFVLYFATSRSWQSSVMASSFVRHVIGVRFESLITSNWWWLIWCKAGYLYAFFIYGPNYICIPTVEIHVKNSLTDICSTLRYLWSNFLIYVHKVHAKSNMNLARRKNESTLKMNVQALLAPILYWIMPGLSQVVNVLEHLYFSVRRLNNERA